MRIALIGGAGFVGHHLCQLPHKFLAIDNLGVNNLLTIQKKYRPFIWERLEMIDDFMPCNAVDYHALSKVLSEFQPDIIVHLSAVAHIDRAEKSPMDTFLNSQRTLENGLDIARAIDAKFVYFSSSTVYGDFSSDVIDEDEPLTPRGIYGNVKLAGEAVCRGYHQAYDMDITIVRPQALYGPRCVSRRVTQIFIENAMQGKPIVIHGSGKDKHDFTYIDDLVSGMNLIFKPWEGLRTYNLTGESATSVQALADMVVERFPTEIIHTDADPLKPSRGTMSCGRIRTELGYRPKFPIEIGMDLYMDWYQEKGYGRQENQIRSTG